MQTITAGQRPSPSGVATKPGQSSSRVRMQICSCFIACPSAARPAACISRRRGEQPRSSCNPSASIRGTAAKAPKHASRVGLQATRASQEARCSIHGAESLHPSACFPPLLADNPTTAAIRDRAPQDCAVRADKAIRLDVAPSLAQDQRRVSAAAAPAAADLSSGGSRMPSQHLGNKPARGAFKPGSFSASGTGESSRPATVAPSHSARPPGPSRHDHTGGWLRAGTIVDGCENCATDQRGL